MVMVGRSVSKRLVDESQNRETGFCERNEKGVSISLEGQNRFLFVRREAMTPQRKARVLKA
jgi:hypothetical protein